MPDNVGYTPGFGSIVAADEVGGILFQRIKVVLGPDGVDGGDVAPGNPMPVTGTVTVGGVTGTLSNNTAPPAADNLGVLPAIANAAAPAYAEGNQVLLSTNLAGALRVAASISGAVTGTLTHNAAAPAALTQLGVLPAVASVAAPAYTAGDQVLLSTDTAGALRTTGSTAGSLSNNAAPPAANNVGALTAIANAAAPAYTEGNQVLPSVNLSGAMREIGTASHNGAAPVASSQLGVLPAIANAAAPVYTEGRQVLASVDLGGALREIGTLTNDNAAPAALSNLGVLSVRATAAAPAYTEGNQALLSTNLGGALREIGTLTHNSAAPAALSNLGVLPGIANVAAPVYVEGDQVLLSTDLAGSLRTTATISGSITGSLSNNTAAPAANNLGVLPAVANAAAPAYTEGNQVLASVNLSGALREIGTATHNGAAPVASSQLGVLPAIANAAAPAYTEGRQVLASTDLAGALRTLAPVSSTGTQSSVAASATNVTLLAANTSRRGATIYNDSTKTLYVKFGATASTTSYATQLGNGSYLEIPFGYTGIIDGLWSSASGSARITELT